MGINTAPAETQEDEVALEGGWSTLDCSTTACPSTCTCAKSKCASEINDCLSDASCASGQSCVDQCKCGDRGCLVGCQLRNPSAKAVGVMKCVMSSCPVEQEVKSLDNSMETFFF